MNDETFRSFKFLKLKYRKGDKIIQPFCRIGITQEIRSPLFNLKKFKTTDESTAKSCRTYWNLTNDKELRSLKFLKLKYRKGDQIIQPFCTTSSHQEIRSPVFNLKKFQKIDKSTGESIGTHWSAMNDKEFDSLKFLKLKYRRGIK